MRQISKVMRSGNWKLRSIVQAGIEEPAFPVHLKVGNEGVPVRHGTPAGPGMQVHSPEPKSWGNQRRARNVRSSDNTICDLLGVECLSVQDQLGIEFSWPPTVQHLSNCGLI